MVLARDRDAAGAKVLDRMVRAVMAERQSRRRRTDRATDELMAEADPEDREGAVHSARGGGFKQRARHGGDEWNSGGVTGPVRDDDPVWRPREDLAGERCRRENLHRGAFLHEAADLVFLHSRVEERDARTAPDLPLEPGGFHDERLCGERLDRSRRGHGLARNVLALRAVRRHLQDRAAQRPLRTQATDESTRVDPGEPGHAVRAQVGLKVDRPFAARTDKLADDEPLDPGTPAL